jgi:hypothetical protein
MAISKGRSCFSSDGRAVIQMGRVARRAQPQKSKGGTNRVVPAQLAP